MGKTEQWNIKQLWKRVRKWRVAGNTERRNPPRNTKWIDTYKWILPVINKAESTTHHKK